MKKTYQISPLVNNLYKKIVNKIDWLHFDYLLYKIIFKRWLKIKWHYKSFAEIVYFNSFIEIPNSILYNRMWLEIPCFPIKDRKLIGLLKSKDIIFNTGALCNVTISKDGKYNEVESIEDFYKEVKRLKKNSKVWHVIQNQE